MGTLGLPGGVMVGSPGILREEWWYCRVFWRGVTGTKDLTVVTGEYRVHVRQASIGNLDSVSIYNLS